MVADDLCQQISEEVKSTEPETVSLRLPTPYIRTSVADLPESRVIDAALATEAFTGAQGRHFHHVMHKSQGRMLKKRK